MRQKIRLIFTLYLIFTACSCSLLAKPTEVDFLIPMGYMGGVIVLFNQPDGIEAEKNEEGIILYRIPPDGFLKVKTAFENKAYKFKYYYVDAQNNRQPIEYLYPRHYVRDPGDNTSKSFDTITEEENNNRVFVINHKKSNFNSDSGRIFFTIS